MAGVAALKIEGGKELRRTMKQAGGDMKDLSAANRAAASIVAAAAKNTTPVGPPERGHIKTTVRAGATQRAGVVRVGNQRLPYGGSIHWGWPARGIKARPWVSQAAQATESRWVDLYWDKLNQSLNKIKGK